jgi:hypothetical protein
MAAEIHVPPLRFLTASTACSSQADSGLLHPDTGPGVRWVSAAHVVVVSRRGGHGLLSLQRVYPSKVCSSSAAVPDRSGLLPFHWSPNAHRCAPDPIPCRRPGHPGRVAVHLRGAGMRARAFPPGASQLRRCVSQESASQRALYGKRGSLWTLSMGAGFPLAKDPPYPTQDASTANAVASPRDLPAPSVRVAGPPRVIDRPCATVGRCRAADPPRAVAGVDEPSRWLACRRSGVQHEGANQRLFTRSSCPHVCARVRASDVSASPRCFSTDEFAMSPPVARPTHSVPSMGLFSPSRHVATTSQRARSPVRAIPPPVIVGALFVSEFRLRSSLIRAPFSRCLPVKGARTRRPERCLSDAEAL